MTGYRAQQYISPHPTASVSVSLDWGRMVFDSRAGRTRLSVGVAAIVSVQ